MAEAPRVSVGLIVYNGENYLAEALDSLLAQTWWDFELILSDNASTDATQSICRDYAARDPRIRYLRQPHNRGACWNHNFVIRESRGEFFKLAAHDDVCAPEMIARCVERLDADPGIVLAYPRTRMMMRGDMSRLRLYQDEVDLDAADAAERFGDLIHEAPPAFPIFGLVRREILMRTPLFEPYKAGDRVLLARLALLGRFGEIEEPLFFYRWHESNVSHLMNRPAAFYDWWKEGSGGGRVYPEWRLVYEWLRSVWLAPLDWSTRRRCLAEIRRWMRQQAPVLKWELGSLVGRGGEPPAAPGLIGKHALRARRRQWKRARYRTAGGGS